MHRIDYAPRAIADRRSIIDHYLRVADRRIADAFEYRLRHAIDRLRKSPRSAALVVGRPGVRVLLLRRFPYKVFFRISDDAVVILHIRHMSRRAWTNE